MKKLQYLLLRRFALVALSCAIGANASGFESGGICYNITGANTVEVTAGNYYGNYSGDISIPSMVTYEGTVYSVTAIDSGAFEFCADLTGVDIPNSVTTIGYRAFDGCRNLTSVVIGNSVQSIGYWAFGHTDDYNYYNNYCDSIKTVTCFAVVPPAKAEVGEDDDYYNPDPFVFFTDYTYDNAVLRVPEGSLEAYQNAEGWKRFVHIEEIDDLPHDVPGDVDGDGRITIGDVTVLIDVILSGTATVEANPAADVDGDGRITIGDVTAIIDHILAN